ncbi:MAG: hypothetical protein ACREUZ_13080 [Burkholderiales bacterium]
MAKRLEPLSVQMRALSESFARQSEQFAQRFEQADRQFAQIDARFEQVDARFEQVNERFELLKQQIAAEGERTRHHFDIVAEQMRGERNLSIDVSKTTDERLMRYQVSNAGDHVIFETRLADHERRLRAIEHRESDETPDS